MEKISNVDVKKEQKNLRRVLFFAVKYLWIGACPIGGELMVILYSRYNEWSSNREKKLNLNGLSLWAGGGGDRGELSVERNECSSMVAHLGQALV